MTSERTDQSWAVGSAAPDGGVRDRCVQHQARGRQRRRPQAGSRMRDPLQGGPGSGRVGHGPRGAGSGGHARMGERAHSDAVAASPHGHQEGGRVGDGVGIPHHREPGGGRARALGGHAHRLPAHTMTEAASSRPSLDAVSLFSNCGAGDVGFSAGGFRFRVMAELVRSRLDIALRNHRGAVGVLGDLRQTWPDVVEQWRQLHGSSTPALVAACPPCQGMSTVRSNRGPEGDADAGSRDGRNLLVLPIAQITNALRPRCVVVENVTGFLRRMVKDPQTGDGISAARLLVRLLTKDYVVYPFLTDLADFGVPQRRKRAFLTFVRRSTTAARTLQREKRAPYPVPSHAPDHGGHHVLLQEALRSFELPALDAADSWSAGNARYPLHFVPVWPRRQHQMVAAIPPGSGASAWENNLCGGCGPVETDTETVECPVCREPLLRPIVRQEGRNRLVRGFRRASYRRMEPDRPAATITTASGRIGGSRTIHPFENRVLSPLECALLQTIPPRFDWGQALETRGVSEIRAMIGEAVPPHFTEMHGRVLASLLTQGDGGIPLIDRADSRCESARRSLGDSLP